ncbi:DMP19 family protein [Spirosoma oryzicola]|uniref:DMP19 family protein n=1 Tax=Spirosoma oryzicola TaxID=2898794 RepID=UPI001E47AD1A|nr:DUF4375 domain-containing protein [Spirosoma oryzicola]UHG91711.1 DMP19 family protein [Spirosoma oryzicola]
MENENDTLINERYYEAVSGLTEAILHDYERWYRYIIDLPRDLQVVYTIGILNYQVLNGGLHQYFFNSYGQFAYLTIDHLKRIKALKAASILGRAIHEVNKDQYSVDEFRMRISERKLDRIVDFDEELADELEKLTDEYYALEGSEDDLLDQLGSYLAHFK